LAVNAGKPIVEKYQTRYAREMNTGKTYARES